MLQSVISTNVPNSTYFRTSDAEPSLEEDTLTVYSGTGTHRSSWGTPGVTSTIVLNTDDLVVVHVGFFHKHGGGQFWRYYHREDQWQQATWAQLTDEDRQRVLNAYEDRAPSFAKMPGKLRKNYQKPVLKTMTTYKLVEVIDGKYYSVYDGQTEYTMGKRLAEKAVTDHGGGYYSYPSTEGLENSFKNHTLFPDRCYDDPMVLALIECEISGTILSYDGKKYASTYIRPLRVVKQIKYPGPPTMNEEAC